MDSNYSNKTFEAYEYVHDVRKRLCIRYVYYCWRSEEHTSELQSRLHLVCRLLLEKKKEHRYQTTPSPASTTTTTTTPPHLPQPRPLLPPHLPQLMRHRKPQ